MMDFVKTGGGIQWWAGVMAAAIAEVDAVVALATAGLKNENDDEKQGRFLLHNKTMLRDNNSTMLCSCERLLNNTVS